MELILFVMDFSRVQLNVKWGVLHHSGKEVTKLKYDMLFYFHDGLAKVVLNGETFYINELGTEIKPE